MRKRIIIFGVLAMLALLAGYFFLVKPKALPLSVVATEPKNNAQLVDPKGEVVITLNRVVTQQDGSQLKVVVSPEEKVNIVYQENKIRLSPETALKIDTKYEISVVFKGEGIYTLVFTTFPLSQEKLEEDGAKQSAADLAFGERYAEFLTSYPWYTKLPIETSEYRVVYDFETASFRIRLKLEPQDESTKEGLVNKALDQLKRIGVPEPIDYYVLVGE